MSEQTVIRKKVSVEKEVARAGPEPSGEFNWHVALEVSSEHDYPVAVKIRDQLPAALGPTSVALPSEGNRGTCSLGTEYVTYRTVVQPDESVSVTYLLNADVTDRETLIRATSVDTIQPVDPAADGGVATRTPDESGVRGANAMYHEIVTDNEVSPGGETATAETVEPATGGIGSVDRFETSERAASESDVLVPRGSRTQPMVSFVIPTMNEEAGIGTCIQWGKEALRELGVTGEIVVSDSSDPDDRTPEIAAEAGAHVVTPDKPGYGYAYQYGFARTRGEYVVIGDADTTYDFRDLPRLFETLQQADADMVLGSRLDGEIRPGAMPALHQYVGNPLLTAFLNRFYDAGVSDAHSGFRLIRREALEELSLQSEGMEFASEMIMQAAERGLDIAEVPIVYHEREGEATLDSFRDGWRHVRFMLLNAPGYLFTGPALGLGMVGAVLMLLSLLTRPIGGVYFGDHTMIAGSLLLIVGYQVGSLGLFSSVAAEPIRSPRDPITESILDRFRLEHGTSLGLGLFGVGAMYTTYLVFRWVQSGYAELPIIPVNLLAFTALVLGVQTVFHSFFLSLLAGSGDETSP